MFSKLSIHHWRQFEKIAIDFHPRLTVLTGANGSGKTTLLHLLNRHWGWNLHYVSGPTPPSDKKLKAYWAGFWGEDEDEASTHSNAPRLSRRLPQHPIGELIYGNGKKATLTVPRDVKEVFDVGISPIGPVKGVYVPSHRPPYSFQKIEHIPVQLSAKEQVFEEYLNEVKTRYVGISFGGKPPSYYVKQSLISLATFGYGNQAVERNEEAIATFEGFEQILRVMLPVSLKFQRLKIKMPDVLLVTETGEISFEAVSGGIAAVIDMAWQIHMYAQLHEEFVVVIDEPEAHLHPALQQRLLPDLLTAFPKAQFVIATHSPFMVTSVPDSNVYVLKYNENQRVDSALLDKANKAGSADEILMDVLGVPSTIPQWAQTKIASIVDEFSKKPLTQDSVNQLRTRMGDLGMGHLFPETLATVAEGKP